MGSAIGDYIHYHGSRYEAFGVERGRGQLISEGPGEGYEEGAKVMEDFVNSRRSFFKSQYELGKLQMSNTGPEADYLNIVKDIINSWDIKYNGNNSYQRGINEGVRIVKELLKQRFGKTVAEKLIKMTGEYFSAKLTKKASELSIKQKLKIKGLQKLDTKNQHYALTVQRTLDQLHAAVKSLREGAVKQLPEAKANKYYEKIRELRSQLSDYVDHADEVRKGTFGEGVKNRSGIKATEIINGYINGKKGPKLANQKNNIIKMYDEINEMIGELKVCGLQKEYVGQAFELVCAIAAKIAAAKAANNMGNIVKELKDFVKKGGKNRNERKNLNKVWTGWHQTNITFENIQFLKGVDVKNLLEQNYTIEQNNGNWDITTSASQDKVDISFKLGGKDFFLSAKNYHLTKRGGTNDVHIVSKVPFFILLLAQTTPQFINHFLNIEAARKDKTLTGLTRAKNLANEAMRLIIAEGALKGYRDTKANMFIINDSTTGEIKMVSTDALLYTISLNLRAYLHIDSTRDFFNNKWNETPEKRITALLQDAYARKISASIEGDILKDVSGMGGISRGI